MNCSEGVADLIPYEDKLEFILVSHSIYCSEVAADLIPYEDKWWVQVRVGDNISHQLFCFYFCGFWTRFFFHVLVLKNVKNLLLNGLKHHNMLMKFDGDLYIMRNGELNTKTIKPVDLDDRTPTRTMRNAWWFHASKFLHLVLKYKMGCPLWIFKCGQNEKL